MNTNNNFKIGQKWVSNAEPELGMGRIVSEEGRIVTLAFDLVDEVRTYSTEQAPVTRARFAPGDSIKTADLTLVVESVTEADGLLVYHGHYQGTETAVIETDLDPNVRFSKPEQRLLTGQIDDNRWFNLRYQALDYTARLATSPLRGLIGPRVSLVPHQLYIASEVASRYAPRVLLADEVGLGKTIEAGLILHQQLATGRASRALIIVPPALTMQWFVEMIRRFNLSFTLLDEDRCQIVEASNRSEDAEDAINNPFEAQQLVLCSLELFDNPLRLEQALAADWDLIIVDEAHHLHYTEEAPSEDYQRVELLASKARGLLLLTATPEQLGRLGHFSRLRLLDPPRYESYEKFVEEEAHYQDIAELVRRLLDGDEKASDGARKQIMALLETRKGFFHKVFGEGKVPATQREGQEDQELLTALLDGHGTGRVLFRNVRESVGGFPHRVLKTYPLKTYPLAVGDDEASDDSHDNMAQDPRVVWLIEQLSASDDKHLVICSEAETAIRLERHIRENTGIRSAAFHEGMDMVSRDRAASYFADTDDASQQKDGQQQKGGAKVLVCSELGSEGRNFQFASQLVMFDLPVAPDLLEQRIGRLDRIGQMHDVTIHVPYIEGSPQHDLLRWYRDGLQLFYKPNPVAQAIFDEQVERYEVDSLDDIIADCKRETESRLAMLATGRDQLLELNSHRPEISAELLAQLHSLQENSLQENSLQEPQEAGQADSPANFSGNVLGNLALQTWLDQAIDLYGLESEPLGDKINLVKPTESMVRNAPVSAETMDRFHFPELPDEGIAVTADRDTALAREDVQYITWEAPLVEQALDAVLSDFTGNCSVIAVPVDALQAARMAKGTMLLETIHLVECLARTELFAARFMPARPVRCLISPTLKDLSDLMDYHPFEAPLNIPASTLEKVVASQEEGIRLLLGKAQESAAEKLDPIKAEAHAAMQQFHDREIARLTRLARVNPNVRQQEIDHLADARAELAEAIAAADIRLEAVRIIIAA